MEFLIIVFLILLVLGVIFILLLVAFVRGGLIGKFIVISLIVFFLHEIYREFFPSDSFFKYDFNKVTGLAFPASGKILKKYASFPDFHGDYESCALIQVSVADYEKLKISLKTSNADKDINIYSSCNWLNENNYSDYSYFKTIENTDEIKSWGTLKGDRMVYFEYSSW